MVGGVVAMGELLRLAPGEILDSSRVAFVDCLQGVRKRRRSGEGRAALVKVVCLSSLSHSGRKCRCLSRFRAAREALGALVVVSPRAVSFASETQDEVKSDHAQGNDICIEKIE